MPRAVFIWRPDMTEKEKMERGELFDPEADAEMCLARRRCAELCYEYNRTAPWEEERRAELLGRMIGRLGRGAVFTPPFWCDYGSNISVGDGFYSNHNVYFTDGVAITIGDHVLIGPNCCLTTAEHALDPVQRAAGLEYARPIRIGDNVWIGAGCTVLAGAEIGDNSVIAAGSVVKGKIPPNVVAAGVPCRVLRELGK